MTWAMVNVRAGTASTPAIGFITVRTIGMNLASTIAFAGPYLSMASFDLATPRCNAGRVVLASSRVPRRLPITKPTCAPITAPAAATASSGPSGNLRGALGRREQVPR